MVEIYTAEKKKEKSIIKEELENREGLDKELSNCHNSSFSTFIVKPEGITFETQDPEEKIILLLRSHWITNIPWISLALVLIFSPVVLSSFPIIAFLPPNYQFMSLIIWYLLVTAFVLESFLSWIFDIYIVTDERIIDVEFVNLLHKKVAEAEISKIQDVTYKVGGVIPSIFNYGDVFIQTAGTKENFDFLAIPQPEKATKVLQGLRTEEAIEAIEGRIR